MDTTSPPTDLQPYELTRNPVDETWGFICREHGTLRTGLSERHAHNVEAKHIREDHSDPLAITLNLSEAARSFLHYTDQGSASVWKALTGLDYPEGTKYAEELAAATPDITAVVAPF